MLYAFDAICRPIRWQKPWADRGWLWMLRRRSMPHLWLFVVEAVRSPFMSDRLDVERHRRESDSFLFLEPVTRCKMSFCVRQCAALAVTTRPCRGEGGEKAVEGL